jgi:hypothetical protein
VFEKPNLAPLTIICSISAVDLWNYGEFFLQYIRSIL